MIPRFAKPGRSFSGLAQYLCHDPKAETATRVAWTHTLNSAHDDSLSAVDEMYTTVLNAAALKLEAGIKSGGRRLEKPVKHFNLNWHPSDTPDRHHMIETAEGFLRHMGWQQHQALLVAHDDTDHPHVHVMLNAVHPETGLALKDDYSKRRAQECALHYEQAQRQIHCHQRLLALEKRTPELTRAAWVVMKEAEHAIPQQHRPQMRKTLSNKAYTVLREVMRRPWAAYYEAIRRGGSRAMLAAFRRRIIARQIERWRQRCTAEIARWMRLSPHAVSDATLQPEIPARPRKNSRCDGAEYTARNSFVFIANEH